MQAPQLQQLYRHMEIEQMHVLDSGIPTTHIGLNHQVWTAPSSVVILSSEGFYHKINEKEIPGRDDKVITKEMLGRTVEM